MKEKISAVAKPHHFAYNIFFRAAGVLLLLTMFSIWLVCGLFAKYIVADTGSDSARTAGAGEVAILEHKVEYNNGIEYTHLAVQQLPQMNIIRCCTIHNFYI